MMESCLQVDTAALRLRDSILTSAETEGLTYQAYWLSTTLALGAFLKARPLPGTLGSLLKHQRKLVRSRQANILLDDLLLAMMACCHGLRASAVNYHGLQVPSNALNITTDRDCDTHCLVHRCAPLGSGTAGISSSWATT